MDKKHSFFQIVDKKHSFIHSEGGYPKKKKKEISIIILLSYLIFGKSKMKDKMFTGILCVNIQIMSEKKKGRYKRIHLVCSLKYCSGLLISVAISDVKSSLYICSVIFCKYPLKVLLKRFREILRKSLSRQCF